MLSLPRIQTRLTIVSLIFFGAASMYLPCHDNHIKCTHHHVVCSPLDFMKPFRLATSHRSGEARGIYSAWLVGQAARRFHSKNASLFINTRFGYWPLGWAGSLTIIKTNRPQNRSHNVSTLEYFRSGSKGLFHGRAEARRKAW